MRHTTAFAGAVATAAILSATAAAAPKPPTTLSLTAAPNPVVFGGNVALAGKLTGPKVANQKITLRSDPFPFDAFANAADATTDAAGNFSLTQGPTVNTRYQVRQGKSESAILTVLVRPKVSLRLSDRTPAVGQRVRFSGRVCPEHDGIVVSIQRRSNGRFRTIRRATLRDIPNVACSSYRSVIRVRATGRYRVVIGAHVDHARGVSPARRATVG